MDNNYKKVALKEFMEPSEQGFYFLHVDDWWVMKDGMVFINKRNNQTLCHHQEKMAVRMCTWVEPGAEAVQIHKCWAPIRIEDYYNA